MIKFTLPIVPTAQARARHGRFGAYKSDKQEANERTLEACLLEHKPKTPLSGPVKLSIVAVMPVPKSASKKLRGKMLAGEERPTKKPDGSNLAKQIEDCCTRLQFWHDDSQITFLSIEKRYGESGRWEVEITELR